MSQIGQTSYSRYRRYFIDNLSSFYKKKKNRVYGGAILTLVTIAFFAVFAIRPTANTITALIKKIDDQKQVAQALETKINALAQAQQQFSAVSNKLYLLDEALPLESQFNQLAQQLELLTQQAKVETVDLKFSKIELWGDGSSKLEPIQFTLSVRGQYSELKTLLSLFPQSRRIIKIEKFAFQKNKNNDDESLLNLSLQGQAFYLKED